MTTSINIQYHTVCKKRTFANLFSSYEFDIEHKLETLIRDDLFKHTYIFRVDYTDA